MYILHHAFAQLPIPLLFMKGSLRSRRLEVAGERENGRARGRPFFLVPTTSKRLLRRLHERGIIVSDPENHRMLTERLKSSLVMGGRQL